eukprot:1162029-Pelagomonas_calceolata.AAC.11
MQEHVHPAQTQLSQEDILSHCRRLEELWLEPSNEKLYATIIILRASLWMVKGCCPSHSWGACAAGPCCTFLAKVHGQGPQKALAGRTCRHIEKQVGGNLRRMQEA